ncbi:MAG TPA: integrase arm-type DNA-binding domain-containing protein [Rhizomicrobium sp.]|nr:integrase arm-type DNA-binding domain-containing protein [Rhizomicrobium sp.]
MALTDAKCRAEKAGPVRRKLSDGHGLQLWVQPSGSKLWQLSYSFQGKQKQIALGPFPEVSLAEARDKRDTYRRGMREGVDPAATRPRKSPFGAVIIGAGDTFREVSLEYLEKRRREQLAAVTMTKKEWLIDLALPSLGDKRCRDIKPVDVLRVLQELEARDCFETARRLRGTVGAVFRYAVITDRADNDPTPALRGAIATPKTVSRAAIIEPKKFGQLLKAIFAFDGQPTTVAALKLMAILFPRPGELRMATWVEFDFQKATWAIPAERTKMRREHLVPLPRQALAILKGLREITGHREMLFPGLITRHKPISENTMNVALRRLGFGQEEMTSHGFRASASTLLNESGKWSEDAIERQLAHIDKNAVRRAYARGQFWEERVAMMAWWADHIDGLRAAAP